MAPYGQLEILPGEVEIADQCRRRRLPGRQAGERATAAAPAMDGIGPVRGARDAEDDELSLDRETEVTVPVALALTCRSQQLHGVETARRVGQFWADGDASRDLGLVRALALTC